MEYKLLEKEDLELMKEIIEDDDIEFDLEKINEFYNDRKLQTIFYKGIMPSEKGFRFSSGL